MADRSVICRYWISFDEEGEIKSFYKNKYDAKEPCQEFIVKLIPIERDVSTDINNSINGIEKSAKKAIKSLDSLDTEFKKTIRGLKGVLK